MEILAIQCTWVFHTQSLTLLLESGIQMFNGACMNAINAPLTHRGWVTILNGLLEDLAKGSCGVTSAHMLKLLVTET